MKTLAALTLALAGTVTALAQPQEPNTPPLVADGGPPVVARRISNGVEYLNGGADVDTATYLKSRGAEYPLQVVITGPTGHWGVADLLTLRGANGETVTVANAGPYVLFKLPPGSYQAEATFGGKVERRTLSVGTGVSKVNWSTPRAAD